MRQHRNRHYLGYSALDVSLGLRLLMLTKTACRDISHIASQKRSLPTLFYRRHRLSVIGTVFIYFFKFDLLRSRITGCYVPTYFIAGRRQISRRFFRQKCPLSWKINGRLSVFLDKNRKSIVTIRIGSTHVTISN